jgi:hypothetical protein
VEQNKVSHEYSGSGLRNGNGGNVKHEKVKSSNMVRAGLMWPKEGQDGLWACVHGVKRASR